MVNLVNLNTDQQAFADVAGGDDDTIAIASNGRQTPSMQKVLKDQLLFKSPILWTLNVNVTDFLQPYESPIDGFAYAPAVGKVPFVAALDPSTDATNWSLLVGNGYVNGSAILLDMAGADIDMNGGDILNVNNADFNNIDNTPIGQSVPAAGTFTDGIFTDLSSINAADLSSGGAFFGGITADNLLDDIDQDLSWTPTVSGTTISGTFTYGTRIGEAYKVGKKINFSVEIDVSATSVAPTGSLRITGLPVTAASKLTISTIAYGGVTLPANVVDMIGQISGSSVISMVNVKGNGDVLSSTNGDVLSAAFVLRITGFYYIN